MMHMTRKIASEGQDESMADIEPPPLKIKTFQEAMQSFNTSLKAKDLQLAMSIGDAVDDVTGLKLASSTQTTPGNSNIYFNSFTPKVELNRKQKHFQRNAIIVENYYCIANTSVTTKLHVLKICKLWCFFFDFITYRRDPDVMRKIIPHN